MNENIESYNSSYPLAYYEVGNVYAFYGQKMATTKLASKEQIERFSGILRKLETKENTNTIKAVKGKDKANSNKLNSHLNRFYAVVVEKVSGTKSKINVMFLNRDDAGETFLIRSYAVNFGCNTDGKDLMKATTSTNIREVKEKNENRIGGITKAEKKGKVGGITKAGLEHTSQSIGGITRANKKSEENKDTKIDNSILTQRVGGITRANKIGGITRVKE